MEAPFDHAKYKDIYKGFRIVRLAANKIDHELRPMKLRGPVQASVIYTPYNSPLLPSAEPHYSVEGRFPIGITFEREHKISGSNLSFAFFSLSGNVFTVESLWEDNGGPQYPEGSVGFFSCYRMIYAGLLFGERYYRALGITGDFQMEFSLESSIVRNIVMDSRGYWSFHQQFINNMSIPVSVEKSINTDASVEQIDSFANEMIREFCWYFHFDLSEADAATFLERVKKEYVVVPKDILQSDENKLGEE